MLLQVLALGVFVPHSHLVNVGVEDAINKANARAFVGILVGELYVDLPDAAGEWCYVLVSVLHARSDRGHVLSVGPLKRT